MLLLFVWNHSYFLARSLGSSRVQLLENIPSKLAWGTFCAKMPSNLLYYCLFLHNDLLLFGQVAAHLIQRSHTTQKHQLPTVHKMQIFIKEQQEQRIWPNFFAFSSLLFPGNSLLSRSSNSLSALEKLKMEKGALSSVDEDPDIPNFKTYFAHKLIQAKMSPYRIQFWR